MIEVAKAMQHSGRISGATKLIGLIGSPVQNSGSPKIHNAVFEHLGLDYAYIAFDVDNDRLEDTVRGMAAMGFLGYNVTTPCKTFVLPFLDEVSEAAEILGYSKAQTFLRIIFPQVFKRIVPALGNEVIVLVKDTSLAFTIGVAEMFTTARAIVSAQGTLTAFVVAALFYWVFTFVVELAISRIEKRLAYYHD